VAARGFGGSIAGGAPHPGGLMLWTVVRIEARNLVAEKTVWVVLALLCAMVAYAAWTGTVSVRAERQAMVAALAEQQGRLEALRSRLQALEAGGPAARHDDDPADPAQVGQKLAAQVAVLPPGPLAAVAVGQRDLAPGIVHITSQGKLGATGDATLAGPTRLMTGAFDLAFVFVYLLPLVIIALTYDLLAGERERGTLALVLAQPVSLATFVLGKTLQRGLVVSGVTVALALLAVAASAPDLASADGLLRLGLYLAALIAYAAFWFAAALAVNARGQTSAGNALALVGLWLTLVVVVPGIVRVVVEAAYPPPSRVELVNLTRAAAAEIETELSALEGKHERPATGPDKAVAATERIVAVQEALEKRAAPVLLAFRTQLAAQQTLVDKLRFLSPAIVLHEALGDVAGTGASRLQDFAKQVDTFQAAWRRYFFSRIHARQKLTSADHATLPRFAFVEETPAVLGARVSGGIAGLLLPAALLVLFAAAVLRKGSRVF